MACAVSGGRDSSDVGFPATFHGGSKPREGLAADERVIPVFFSAVFCRRRFFCGAPI
jgi:hypothetical protein